MNASVPHRLKAIGFWRGGGTPRRWPRPQWLVDHRWDDTERTGVLAYLNWGVRVAGWCGYSVCRCCRLSGPAMGSAERTDGEWLWPEGFGHYVEQHGVRPPDEFVATARRNNWQMPAAASDFDRMSQFDCDFTFWEQWSRRRRPWYALW